jgi:hypothetical protein
VATYSAKKCDWLEAWSKGFEDKFKETIEMVQNEDTKRVEQLKKRVDKKIVVLTETLTSEVQYLNNRLKQKLLF